MPRLPVLIAFVLLPACWLTRGEVDQKVQEASDPPEETGDTGEPDE